MTGTIRIGHFFGFDVSVHWSWVIIFVLITATFAEGVLDSAFPRWTGTQLWTVAIGIAILFFISILLHEISHSIVARRYGIPVRSIVLFIFGGVSNLERDPDSARQEFWIAIAGPVTSFVIAGIFGLGWLIVSALDEGASTVFLRLALINVGIGGFNLVPGYPLDGGRVLRSIFWARNKDIIVATRMASQVGHLVANLIMAAGVAMFVFGHDLLSGIWLFLIGNFLRSSASVMNEQVILEKVMTGIPAERVVRHDFTPISPEISIDSLVEDHLLSGTQRAFPVMAGEELLGIVTLSDVRRVPREEWPRVTVYRAMTPFERLKTVTARDELTDVLATMATFDINQVPLLDGRILKGMIHRSDILRYIQTQQELHNTTSPRRASARGDRKPPVI